jgi:hypothetical protein
MENFKSCLEVDNLLKSADYEGVNHVTLLLCVPDDTVVKLIAFLLTTLLNFDLDVANSENSVVLIRREKYGWIRRAP